tara:strand:+ start:4816 stop:5826 length:1011 start_codon:yes stop_codon:yes gene_type:complete
MEMLEEGGIATLTNKMQEDFEAAPELGLGSEIRKAFKKLGPAIGAVVGAAIGGAPGAAIGAGIGTKTSASDNYAQNMLLAAGLAGGLGVKGQGLESVLLNPKDAFATAFRNIGSSPLGSIFSGKEAAEAAKQADKITALDVQQGKASIQDYIAQSASPVGSGEAVEGSNILDRIKGGIGSLEEFAKENPLTTQLGTQLLFPKLVEAIYGKDPYGTQGRFSFADQGLRPAVNPLQNNPYIQGSVVSTPSFPNLRNFVGADRAMFGGKIGMKNGGKGDKAMVRPDGEIRGPGTPTSDDIPVYLSDQEYVLPKVMVDYLGGGDYDQGIANLEAIRTKLV